MKREKGYIYYSLSLNWGKPLIGYTGIMATKETLSKVKAANPKLLNLKSAVDTYILNKQTLLQRTDKEDVKTYITGLLRGKTGQIKLKTYEVLFEYYEAVEANKIKNEGKLFSDAKKNAMKFTLAHINKTYIGKKDIKYISQEDFVWFKDYLFEQGLSRNSVSLYMVYLKFMLKETFKIHGNTVFREAGLNVRTEKKENAIALTIEEIRKIYTTEVSKALEPIRDLFVYGCNVGARYSDLQENLSPESLQNDMFSIATKKTDKNVIIPMTQLAREIWDKYNGALPKCAISNFNTYIKKVCKIAGLTDTVIITKLNKKGEKIVAYTPIYQLVSSHTMRRSFVTTAFFAGVPILVISKFMGHSKVSTTENYLRATPRQLAESVKDNQFFKGKAG